MDILRHGRRTGPTGSPVAIETDFGWVLCGGSTGTATSFHVASLHVSTLSGDDILRKFWETEEPPGSALVPHSVSLHLVSRLSKTEYPGADEKVPASC